jgi:dolichol-phosphate mannosyltransferase
MAISVRAPESGLASVPALTAVFVVPAFNEADNILRLFSDLEQHPQLFGPDSRLVIVDDGSADATADLVESYDGPLPVECLRMGVNQGPGAAFRAGFREVLDGSDEDEFLIVTLEADTTSDLATLPTMLARAEDGADLVLASVHGGGKMVGVNPLRRVLSAGAGVAMRRALQVDARTVSSFFRVYRASMLRRGFEHYGDDLMSERGFACKAEILANLVALGATITEVPTDLDGSRRVGASKMRILPTMAAYWRLAARQRAARGSSQP